LYWEVDVLKSILLLPGVTNAGEVPLDLQVVDQNLILLDEQRFHSSHFWISA
jgi:hypothetical protein